jgi:hypothetical protein
MNKAKQMKFIEEPRKLRGQEQGEKSNNLSSTHI